MVTIVDTLNRAMARDRRLAPIARASNAAHHQDETRHLAFGHRLLRELVDARTACWTEAERAAVARRLTRFTEQAQGVLIGLFRVLVERPQEMAPWYGRWCERVGGGAAQRR